MKRFIQKYFLFFICAFLFHQLSAQTPYYYKIGQDNELPSEEVYQIIQDDFGYIWIGCDAGLFRYDGVRFKGFSSKKQNSKSISGLRIANNTLWCQNFSGQIFKVIGDSLSLVIDISKNIVSYSQYTIDHNNHIWIANDKSIQMFDAEGKFIKSYIKYNDNKDTVRWQEIEINKKGDVFVCSTNHGIASVNYINNNIEIQFIESNKLLNVRTAIESFGENLVALTEINVPREYVISEIIDKKIIERNRFFPFLKDGLIYKIYKDNLNRYWMCTSSGIVKLNKDFKLDADSKFFLNNDKISSIYQDKEGNLWISSLQNGIYVVPNYDLKIFNQNSSPLEDANITSLLVTSANKLLLGTYTGSVYELDVNGNFMLIPQQNEVAYRTVKQMQEKDNGIYVAHGPMSFYDNTNNHEILFKAYNFRDFCWNNDTLYYASSNMFAYLPNFHKLKNNSFGNEFRIIYNKGTRSLAKDEITSTIYFASIDGLFSYKNKGIKEIKLDNKTINANKLYFKNGELWIATVNDGLLVLKNDIIIERFDNKNVLRGNSVKCFKVFGNTIFISTDEGLTKINRINNTQEFYDYTDGIISKEINAIELFNNYVFLATNKGLIQLPTEFTINNVRPNLAINSIFINNVEQLLMKNKFDLNYNQNNVSILFNTACFKARGSFKYKYRLIGLDNTWKENSSLENQVQFSALPSGDFTFEVKAVNEDGFESLKTEQIKFHICPPFWQRWWFYVLMILLGSGIVTVLFMIRIRFIKRRAELRNKVTASQLTALKSQMNPHFLFNTLNSLQDLILKHDIKNSNYYLNKFSLLMREILDTSGKDEISLAREIKLLDTYLELEKLRFGDEFKFVIKVDNDLDTDYLSLPPMIIQPFIENALKHGLLHRKGAKTLIINFKLINDILLCEVIDNGVGRKKSEEIKLRSSRGHQSFATQATDKRMDLLNSFNDKKYSFEIMDLYEEEKSLGTKVIIYIPV